MIINLNNCYLKCIRFIRFIEYDSGRKPEVHLNSFVNL